MKRAALAPTVLAAAALAGCGTGAIDAVGLTPEALVTGSLAHWTFDEGSGTAVADVSGNRHDGTITGSTWTWLDPGRFGRALHLEQGDYVSVDGFPNATASWTVSVWVKIPSQAVGIGEATIISTEDVFKGGWELNVTALTTDLHYHFGFFTGPGTYDWTYNACQSCVRLDQWQHLAAVVDGGALTLAFYVDGHLVKRTKVPQPILPGVPTLYMGRWATSDPPRLLIGSLDDVAIWNRALSSAEIALLNQAPAPSR